MARVIGYVKSLEHGTFFVKDAKGNIRQLKAGEPIHEGELVYGSKSNPSNAQIIIDVTLQGMGDLVIAGNGALNFDTSLLKGIFSHDDAVVYVNSVKDALALAGGNITNVETDLRDGQPTNGEDETAAGQTLSNQEHASDTFSDRDGLVKDVRTSLNFTGNDVSEPATETKPFRPVVLDIIDSSMSVTIDITDGNTADTDDVINALEAPSAKISGTIEAGSTITSVSVSDGVNSVNATNIVISGTTWTADVNVSSLADGALTASVSAQDVLGNSASDTDTITKDTVTTVTLDPINNTNDLTPTFSGTGEAGSTITIKDGTTPIGTATVQPNGTWSFTPTTPLTEGSHTINVTAVDPYGNTNTAAGTPASDSEGPFVIDTTATIDIQTIAGESQSPLTIDTNNYATINAVDKTTGFSISGVTSGVEAGQSVTVQVLDSSNNVVATLANATVAANGSWDTTVPANAAWISDGTSYSFKAIVIDAVGNTATDTDKLNAGPVDGNEINSTNEDTTLSVANGATGDLLNNATDIDGDTLSISGYTIAGINGTQSVNVPVVIASVGTITINENGSYTFAPALNWNGTVPTITYTVSDSHGGMDTSTLTITVNAVNDAPTSTGGSVTGTEDTPYLFSWANFNVSDVDGGTSAGVKITTLPTDGVLQYNNGSTWINITANQTVTQADINAGKLRFVPDMHESGIDAFGGTSVGNKAADYARFDYQPIDGSATNGTGLTATMRVDITPIADTPIVDISGTGIVTEIITTANIATTTNGFTVSALKADGITPADISINSSPDGFGVAGDVDGATSGANNRGALNELQYDTTENASEQIKVTFDSVVSSIDVSFAWQNSHETVQVQFYDSVGALIETKTYYGGTDAVDPAKTLAPTSGESFKSVVFTAPNAGDDYLIHSISFEKVNSSGTTITTDDNRSVDLDASSALVDTDGSETLSTSISGIPAGYTITDGIHTSTAGSSVVDVTNWNLANLRLNVPVVAAQETVTLTITATTSESSNGSQATASDTINIVVVPYNDAPVIVNAVTNVSEEGLTNGIADTNPTGTDTTNFAVSTGTMNISDPEGSAVAVTLIAPTTAMTSGGTTVTWTLSGDQKTLTGMAGTKEVITVGINNSGTYTVTLKAPIDHATANVEDLKSLAIGVRVNDESSVSIGTLIVNIEDDAPTAGNITQLITLPPQDTNITLVLDVSGSMSTTDGPSGATRLATMQQAANNLLDGYDNFGDVKVRLVTFSTNAAASGSVWMTVAEAKAAINALTANGGTNYDEALADAISAYSSAGKIDGASNVAYVISDGAPTFGSGTTSELAPAGQSPGTPSTNGTGYDQSGSDTGIQSAEQTIWESFLTNNDVKAYAIGIGGGAVSTYLEPIAFDGNNGTQTAPIMVTDLSQLSSALQKTIVPPTVGSLSGNFESNSYGLGADGGYIKSLIVNGITYTYNPTAHTVTPTGTGGSSYTYDSATDVLTITTADKGILIIDLDVATYTYQAPATLAASATLTETIGFTMNDNDGDSASGTLTLNVAHATEVLLATTSTAITASAMGLSGEYFGYNDATTSTTNGYIGTTATRVHTDDATVGNIDLLADVETIVEGRNNNTNLIGTATASVATAADATFTAYKLEFGLQAGTTNPLFSNDLGQNTRVETGNTVGSSNNNLYRFLKGSNTANTSNIVATSGVGDTTDAVIRMVGYVYVVGGTYDLRVTADDGYRIYIGGQNVANVDKVQSTTTNIFTGKTIADGWQPIEILYWDQAGHASFRLETKLTGSADSTYQIVSTDTMPILNANQTPPVLTAQQDMVDTGTGTWSIRTGATYNGDSTDNYVTGTDGKDVIHGGAGNDTIEGGANKDWLYGDEGNDKLVFDVLDAVIDGGTGTDTLILATGTNIDFSALSTANDPIKNMEIIDLGTSGQHSLTNLSLADVIDMTDSNHDLYILGNTGDTVDFLNDNGWRIDPTTPTSTEIVNGASHTFDVYTNTTDSTVMVKVEQAITDTIV